jgi:hypothetical protein
MLAFTLFCIVLLRAKDCGGEEDVLYLCGDREGELKHQGIRRVERHDYHIRNSNYFSFFFLAGAFST